MAFRGMGNLSRTVMSRASQAGDFVLSNSIARYSTMAAGSAIAAYGYANNRPILGTVGALAAGGTAYGSAYRGYFGGTAQRYALNAAGMAKGFYGSASSAVMDRFRGTRTGGYAPGPSMTRPSSFGI